MRPTVRRAIALWLPVAAVATVLSFALYGVVQQAQRSDANDPQLQMAEDAAASLSSGAASAAVVAGPKVDIARSLAPFSIVFDRRGRVLASTADLGGRTPVPPSGVLDAAVERGMNTITWEPRDGVRASIVVVPFGSGDTGGTVLVGRSLREVEEREGLTLLIAGLAWIAALVAAAVGAFLGALLWGRAAAQAP